ncbi:hypothetical protein FF098_004415 [Parvularcula flava]|uniref:Peptidase n=1 Tax=Aquisalinus luteolus TaxID=1566827 RepID=A0A8J3ETN6_9PROT|nr:PepSY-associated TM helix domain-containing protein [Aquisalinus luteolus]NHK27144.1 hypothetical protein [Aquisalinus luteolus]GGH94533.1 hypothetical protein GCM10011355_08940 [Aquisalinus luteolus]
MTRVVSANAAGVTVRQGRKSRPPRKGRLMRLARIVHNYLSAFAFLMLILFALTGILLNHPQWFEGGYSASENAQTGALSQADLGRLENPITEDVEKLVRDRFRVIGQLEGVEDLGDEILIRFKGSKGRSFVTIDRSVGEVLVENERAGIVSAMNALHTGKDTGKAWRFVIDIAAIIILLLSLAGFLLFFMMRFRLGKSLLACGSSLALLAIAYVYFVY